jgi:hypothetical protein
MLKGIKIRMKAGRSRAAGWPGVVHRQLPREVQMAETHEESYFERTQEFARERDIQERKKISDEDETYARRVFSP